VFSSSSSNVDLDGTLWIAFTMSCWISNFSNSFWYPSGTFVSCWPIYFAHNSSAEVSSLGFLIFFKAAGHQFVQPRSQALPSCWGKTLAGAGHVSHGNLIAQGGVGKVSNYMLPLSHFTLLLQGVSVLYRSTLRSYIFAKFDLCLLLNYNNMLNRFL
jgi:hypothetical protein